MTNGTEAVHWVHMDRRAPDATRAVCRTCGWVSGWFTTPGQATTAGMAHGNVAIGGGQP